MRLNNRVIVLLLVAVVIVVGAILLLTRQTPEPPPAPSTTGLTVLDAWTRAANAGETGGLFFTIENGTDQDQVLIAAHTDVAAAVELHETVMSGEMAGMQHVERLLIAAGTTLTAEPGGYHLMLIDLQQDLVSGEAIPVLFTFESGTQVAVEAVVR